MAIAAAVGVGLQMYGSHKESKARKDAAKYQAAVARNNAIISERQGDDRRARGKQEERNFRKQLSQLKGKQRSIYAGAGVTVDEDTPLDVLGQSAELGELDAMAIRNNAEREAYGFEVQGFNHMAQSELFKSKAGNINPLFNAFSTALTGASANSGTFSDAFKGNPKATSGASAGASSSAGASAVTASDKRLKEDIVFIRESESGIDIYEFNYIDYPDMRYRGVIAQEILKTHPQAVITEDNGYYSVNYDLIDVDFEMVEQDG